METTARTDGRVPTRGPLELSARIDTAHAHGVDVLKDGLDYLGAIDLRPNCRRVTSPTLLLHGRKDAVISRHASEFLAAEIPASRLDLFEDAGHDLPVHEAKAVARAMLDFSNALPS